MTVQKSVYTEVLSAGRDKMRMYGSFQRHLVCDVTSADVTLDDADKYCRIIKCDVTGIFKVDYTDDGEHERTWVGIITAGEIKHIPNVIKVYRYYVGTTSTTSGAYTDAGALVTGIRLCY